MMMVNQIEDDKKTLYTNDENRDLSTVTQKNTQKHCCTAYHPSQPCAQTGERETLFSSAASITCCCGPISRLSKIRTKIIRVRSTFAQHRYMLKSQNCIWHVTESHRPTLAGGGNGQKDWLAASKSYPNLLDCAVEAAAQQCLSELQRRTKPERQTDSTRDRERAQCVKIVNRAPHHLLDLHHQDHPK